MIIVILGPQASGKGTQAKLLVKKLNSGYFEAGDVLRKKTKENSPLGREIDKQINQKGQLVSDQLMAEIVKNWLEKVEVQKGLVFDGYPRSLPQFQTLKDLLAQKGAKIEKVIFLKVSRKVSLKRLSSRRICPHCDLEFNLVTKPPKKDELCDQCQQKLIQRKDDTPAVIEKRLAVYHQLTKPLVNHARRLGILEEIDAEGSIEAVYQEVLARLKDREK